MIRYHVSSEFIMEALEALLGSTLVDAAGVKSATSDLNCEVIGLYYSASWCGPW
jgi:hypothetical protein